MPGAGLRLSGRLGVDGQGRFTAISIDVFADLGACMNPSAAHISVNNPAMGLTGCYRIPLKALRVALTFTNATPLGPYRGVGRPDIALMVERLVEEADGQLLTASLMDYGLPEAVDVPPVSVGEHNTAAPNNPFGVKGVGEAGTTGAMAALCSVVADALRAEGAALPPMPFVPETLWRALRRPA